MTFPVKSITHLTSFPENIGPHWRLGGGGRCRSSDEWEVAEPFAASGSIAHEQWDPYEHVEQYLDMLVGCLKDCGITAIWGT